mmetsp:Transcript_7782/g.17562  ORF Transcript_7782/g.17562 Transcript_7782/m.17562 type:complete len:554 (-) Transcript_7782:32-1693(-)|eukprot:CAMPEP_0172322790 /NCGR_PEP_ID=MMETSP1058-20130122/46921_1 /TAXON_ID=83371 /ORGANISM="Detonula confervacea, Strain CCMP 353" /LENGTH=553 /DNA_ID=CAMNT_0013038625 /DNA_START=90 /DNA_END=1751 /DNA_ORIENTATION=-
MVNNKNSSLRSSLSKVQDPIDLELTEVAKASFTRGSHEQLHDESSDMFFYGAAGDDVPDDAEKHNGEATSLSDRFNEENMIDILANVDSEVNDEEHMVTHQEDSLTKTLAGVAGNVLEWYDFAVFGYFSDIIGDVFFPPNQDGNAAIVESFAVFGAAFFMRPVGGVVMGYIGDKYGSRKALTISIFLMAFPTFAMGCLPGYATVGSASIVLLTIVRMMQGLSVGGQIMSSLIFTLERHPKSKWGLYGSYVMAAANLGTLLGGVVATIIRRSLSDEALHSWGWRIPFLSGILVSVSGFYLKNHGEDDESGHIHGAPSNSRANPIRLAFSRSNIRSLLASSMVPLLWSVGFYLTFVWMAVYMADLIEPPVPNSFAVNSASLSLSVCLLFPVAGWLSDKLGRKRVMAVGGMAMAVGSPLMITLIGSGQAATAFCAQMFLGISLSLWGAPMMAWLAESFEPAARLTSVSIGYNIAQACGGGMAPAIATEMVDRLGTETPGYYITVMAGISLVGLLCVAPRVPVHFTALQGEDDSESSNMSEEQTDYTDTEDGDRELI